MAEDRVLKLRRLERLRRRVPHASVSALTSILKDVSDDIPELGTSRGQFREARDATVASDTPYGTVVQHTELPAASGGGSNTRVLRGAFCAALARVLRQQAFLALPKGETGRAPVDRRIPLENYRL